AHAGGALSQGGPAGPRAGDSSDTTSCDAIAGRGARRGAATIASVESELVPEPVGEPVTLGHVARPRPEYARVAPLAPQRCGVQFTLDKAGRDLLQHVQDLLGHEVPRGDLAEVFIRALKAYAALLEKTKQRPPSVPERRAARSPARGAPRRT